MGAVGCRPKDVMSQGWDPKHSFSAVVTPHLMRAPHKERAIAALQACHMEATPRGEAAAEHGLAVEVPK